MFEFETLTSKTNIMKNSFPERKNTLFMTMTFLFFSLFLVIGCRKTGIKDDYHSNAVNITLNDKGSLALDEKYATFIDTIRLETNDKSLLRMISRICVDDDLYFIFDESLSKIVLFDKEGNYVNHIYKVGQGPGEYSQLSDIYVDTIEKQIVLLCDRPEKIMFFNYEGEFIKEKYLNILYRQIASDNEYIYLDNPFHTELENSQIIILNREGDIVSYGLPLLPNPGINLMAPGNTFTKNSTINCVRRFDNSIYELKNGIVNQRYNIDFKQHNLPENIFEGIQTPTQLHDLAREKGYIYCMFNISEGEKYIFVNTNIGIFILDKEKNEIQEIDFIKNPFIPAYTKSNFPINNTNGIFACIYSSYIFNEHKEKIQNGTSKLNEKQREFVLSVKEEDNPILFLYQLK